MLRECFVIVMGWVGIPYIQVFFLKKTSNFDFRAQTNFKVPHWMYDMSREGRSRSQQTCIKGAHVGAKFKRFPERVMSHVRRNIKFKDRVQVLEFKKTQFVVNLLKGAKKDILLHEGESEYTKKRRQEKEAMKKSGKSRVPKEHVGIVLARQKEIEAQFWAAYCRMVWVKIRKLSQEACYGCSHRCLNERDHGTCQMGDVDCIRRFMEMALGNVRCFDVMREWYELLSCLKPPLSENEVLLYDAPWVLERMGHPDRIRILRELMIGDIVGGDFEPFPSMTDEELLEPTDDFMTDEELLEAAADAMEMQQPENTDAMQQPENMASDIVAEFLGSVEEEEESEIPAMEEEERNEGFVPLNPNCYGCCHFLPSQNDHACCNYGQHYDPEEDITDDDQERVCIRFWSLLLLLFVLFILSIFCSPEQFIPSEPIWEWSCPVFFDEDQ